MNDLQGRLTHTHILEHVHFQMKTTLIYIHRQGLQILMRDIGFKEF